MGDAASRWGRGVAIGDHPWRSGRQRLPYPRGTGPVDGMEAHGMTTGELVLGERASLPERGASRAAEIACAPGAGRRRRHDRMGGAPHGRRHLLPPATTCSRSPRRPTSGSSRPTRSRLDTFPQPGPVRARGHRRRRRPVPRAEAPGRSRPAARGILMGVKSARDRARELHPRSPSRRWWCRESAHPAFSKGAHYFGLTFVTARPRADHQLDVDAYRALITPEHGAAGGVGAQSLTLGMVDPIEQLAPSRRAGHRLPRRLLAWAASSCRSRSSSASRSRVGLPRSGRDHDQRGPPQVRLHREGRVAGHEPGAEVFATRCSASGPRTTGRLVRHALDDRHPARWVDRRRLGRDDLPGPRGLSASGRSGRWPTCTAVGRASDAIDGLGSWASRQ